MAVTRSGLKTGSSVVKKPKARGPSSGAKSTRTKKNKKKSRATIRPAVRSKPGDRVVDSVNQSLHRRKPATTRESPQQECPICAESKAMRQFPNVEQAPECGHAVSACRSCIARHVNVEINKHRTLGRVPCFECREHFSESYLELLLSRTDFQKIKTSVARKVLEANPRFRYCLSPKCTAGQVHENRYSMIVVCKTCGAQSCFIHGIPYHQGQTCDQYNSMNPHASTMLTSEERIKTTVKKCPGVGCSYYIEKDGGCPNMHCPKCSQDWVWGDVGFGDE